MTTRAAQIECLLTPVIDHRTTSVASGYTAYFYAAGTSTPKNVWTEKEKTNPYTSRTLGSDGTAQLYGDGVLRIIIKDENGTTVHDWDNIKVQANTFTTQTKADTYTATADDDLILAGGTFTVNLATVTGFTHPLIIKRTSGTITVDPYSTETIDGNSTITLTASDDSAVLYPDISAGIWRRADRLSGLTATVAELNQLAGVTILDEDNMASDSATDLATQQSIKAYSDSATQTMTNKTLTSPVLNTSVSGTAVLDEDNMASDSATQVATQQSIKAYVDSHSASSATRATASGLTIGSSPSTLLTLDHGTISAGDIFIVEVDVGGAKQATAGLNFVQVSASGGTAVCETLHKATNQSLQDRRHVDASQTYSALVTGVFICTTGGTGNIVVSGSSAGSDTTSGTADAGISFLIKN